MCRSSEVWLCVCVCVLQEWKLQWELHHWLHLPAVHWRGQRSLWLQEECPGTHAAGTHTHTNTQTLNMIRILFICHVMMSCRVALLHRLTGTLAPRLLLKPCSGSPRNSKSFTDKVKRNHSCKDAVWDCVNSENVLGTAATENLHIQHS